jgi:hypothetical protein
MELLGFLVVVLAIAATAGAVWLHLGQHTRVELSRRGNTSAAPEPEVAQSD